VIYKNGILFAVPQDFAGINSATSANPLKTSGSMLMYLNGSTDYVEFYVYIFATTAIAGSGNGNTWMTGAMMRAA
jgi:surface antigen